MSLKFRDILYGEIELPEYLAAFVRMPEFVRLRGVGLSNVDSFEMKDFNGPSRWEHGIAVAWLAARCAERRSLAATETVQLILAGLLHDVATPPFAHTAEYVLPGFDHELETQNLLAARPSVDSWPDSPVFESELPQFRVMCEALTRRLRVRIDADEVARMVVGDGDLGFLVSGTLDLDNADNVTRACLYLGLEVDRRLPERLALWLGDQRAIPVDIESIGHPDVTLWLGYRNQLYSAFFEASDGEFGRQAFLQHLMRRALRAGLLRRTVVWNTEEGLLTSIARVVDGQEGTEYLTLNALVRRYRLLEPPRRIVALAIEDPEVFRALQSPQAATWMEQQLSSRDVEAFVMVAARRWAATNVTTLFGDAPGALLAFKLGSDWQFAQLPKWLKDELPGPLAGRSLARGIARVLSTKLSQWAKGRPWLEYSRERSADVTKALESIGDWSFRLSRNDNFHAYPSTFVHAIPASLIGALGLKGELILDPFGGTGQTALEAVKSGGSGITGDSNTIATLVARTRLTFLSRDQRQLIRELAAEQFSSGTPVDPPEFELRDKWHHPTTLAELCSIRGCISQVADPDVSRFLEATFSAVLPATTGRHGRQHGFFADNTPLAGGESQPPYREVVPLYVGRVRRNLELLERTYAFMERAGREPSVELGRARVVQVDATLACPGDYGVIRRSVAAIITSPPYLGMADYSLGSRLSYYWLDPEALVEDFRTELGARRKRFAGPALLTDYLASMRKFAVNSRVLVREGGFVALVIGAPKARAFKDSDVIGEVDGCFTRVGFEPIWSHDRVISWHRNHGYQHLTEERLMVYAAPRDSEGG